jgi:DNA repair protein RecN (Recombination protein N)
MLRYLNIKNLAVIESLEMTLQPGLNVLTGETGAGKSIVVGAVGLLLGDRASADMIRTGEEMAIVQAVFEHEDREILVRREISAAGRSRSFVDDVLVTAGSLRELGVTLVDLHGQHEHQSLLEPDGHVDLLDRFAGLSALRDEVAQDYASWAALKSALGDARRQERDKEQRADFLQFQLREIEAAAPVTNEDAELGASRHLLANAERLHRLTSQAYDQLYEGEGAVVEALASVWKKVEELASLDLRFKAFADGQDAVTAQIEDLAGFLREYREHIDSSPDRLQELEDRLAIIERLKRKYGPSLDDVLAKRAEFRKGLDAIENAGARIAELERDVRAAAERYLERARRLSTSRKAASARFARSLERELADLAMERTRFDVRFADGDPSVDERWTPRGFDVAEFYASPNPGEDLRPLARIASGGELSRVMLALKTLASTDSLGKTLIFDEVDAGIGGRVADVVGQRLQALGARFQVLCITHLPQIAACGRHHFRVTKSVRQERTVTSVEALGSGERVDEIARMMAGAVLTDGSRATAREMLEARVAPAQAQAKGESESRGERRKRKSKG